ncbi:MAG TPA: hypothetical protein VNA13_00125 [Xanthomonadales bacterium]|nr:hypothetical protein [Xanthomonadales bacterium]
MPQQYYGGAIWTNHALDRLSERGLTQDIASRAFNNPDRSMDGRETGTKQYQKRFDKSLVTIVAKQNERSEWIILSCWVDPPIAGSQDEKRKDAYRNYQRASFWGKIWVTVKRQLGLSKY